MEEDTNNNEMVDVDVLEFSLDDEEIDEIIENLQKLKETKSNFNFYIDEANELVVHHEEDEE